MVETQLCKLRGTSDTFVGSAYFIIILLKNKFSSISSTPSVHADYSSEIPGYKLYDHRTTTHTAVIQYTKYTTVTIM